MAYSIKFESDALSRASDMGDGKALRTIGKRTGHPRSYVLYLWLKPTDTPDQLAEIFLRSSILVSLSYMAPTTW